MDKELVILDTKEEIMALKLLKRARNNGVFYFDSKAKLKVRLSKIQLSIEEKRILLKILFFIMR